MTGERGSTRLRGCVASALSLGSGLAHASNGLNLIGFGAESTQMAGADVAVARDACALNTNPAGLTQISHASAQLFESTARALDVSHQDQFGNDVGVSKKYIPVASGAYGERLGGSDWVAGLGAFVQGGAGDVYKHLDTAFGTRDDLWSLFGILKLTAGAGYRVNDAVSLGASVAAVYAKTKQRIFAGTSIFNQANPRASFFGYELDGLSGVNAGLRVGAMWQLNRDVTLGAVFANRVTLPQRNGSMDVDMNAIGLGSVHYSNARIDGLALPLELSTGASYRPDARWMIAFKWSWLNWGDALKTSTLTATGPNNPLAPSTLSSTAMLDWKNQNVLAIGVERVLDERTVVRGGFNYGRNPIPPQTLNPLLAAIGESHLTLGFSRRMGRTWAVDSGIEYLFTKSVTYTNPELPFGQNAQERDGYIALSVGLSRTW
jgi:long-chain fatty acid transport protein